MQLAQSAGKDEVMATELVLQLPLQGGWDILQHYSIHDKSILELTLGKLPFAIVHAQGLSHFKPLAF